MKPITNVKNSTVDTEMVSTAVKNGEVGCVILAGGMGSRLGWDGPKGCIPLKAYGNRTLFEVLVGRAKDMPLAIMTSPHNHAETCKALKNVDCEIFSQDQAPLLDEHKKPIEGSMGPDGNGAVFKVMAPILDRWNVRYLIIIPVDNPKADPQNPLLLSTLMHAEAELVVLATDPSDETGILVQEGEDLHVAEYSESDLEGAYANSGMFACTLDFAKRCAEHTDKLPWHLAKKQVNGQSVWKQERFIFDLFPLAKSYRIVFQPRNECFAPIKYKKDIL